MNFLYTTLAICLCMTSLALAQDTDNSTHLQMDGVGAWGMVDGESEWLINPFYDTLFYLTRTNFDSETYKVTYYKTDYLIGQSSISDKWRLFHKNGNFRYEADAILPRLMGDIVLVKRKDKWGLVATSGKVVLPVKCTAIDWHEDVLALKDKKGNWRLFDPQNGRLEEQKVFDKVTLLSPPNKEVILLVERDGKKGLIDQYFRTLLPMNYTTLTLVEGKKGYVYYEDKEHQCGHIHLKTKKVETTTCKE